MVRMYKIKWYPKKEGQKAIRHTLIKFSNPTGEVSTDAHNAVELFVSSCGNLNKNEIICIKEFDENGQIGEDITPTKESIVPITSSKKG